MSHDSPEAIQRQVRVYVLVFVSLAVLTLVTVGASYLELGVGATIGLALLIATVKASLVACFFMHLIDEKKLIYSVLALTAAFFVVLMLVPIGAYSDRLGV